MRRIDFNQGWSIEGKEVTLPHDAMLYEKREAGSASSTGGAFYNGGFYVYEKAFDVPADWKDKVVRLEFEGVYRNATVKINGRPAGYNAYGYVNFFVNCEGFLHYGEKNLVTVEVDNQDVPNSRWYSGAGIYRPVWLYVAKQTHIEKVRIRTTSIRPPEIEVAVWAAGKKPGDVSRIEIYDGANCIASVSGEKERISLPGATLWDERHPKLYTCKVTLGNDEWEGTFGIRKISWSSKGFFLNDRSVKLRGGCVHHDNGVLGACTYDEAEERRVRLMKEAGYNAIRSSHNPCSESFLRACYKYGMYLIDEMWDMWYERKNRYDYALSFMDCYEADLEKTIERDYNHPSVIMYSIGNENMEPYDAKGLRLLDNIIEICHGQDASRPVTMGLNPAIVHGAKSGRGLYKEPDSGEKDKAGGSMLFNILLSMFHGVVEKMTASDSVGETIYPIIEKLDIVGYNYAEKRYVKDHQKYPDKLFYGSETMPYHVARNWKLVSEHEYICGDFCWTAWDYLGEAGLGSWSCRPEAAGFQKKFPWKLAEAGAIDLIGTKGAEAAYSGAVWDKTKKMCIMVTPPVKAGERVHRGYWRGTNAVESWSFRGCDKNKCVVEVIGHGSRVQLFVNHKKIGEKKLVDAKAVFKTTYESGVVEARMFDRSGACIETATLESATGSLALRITPENTVQKGGLLFIDIDVAGENGVVDFGSDKNVTVTVEGGELLGYGSAEPCTLQRFVDGTYRTYMGRSLAVVRGTSENVRICARTEGGSAEKVISLAGAAGGTAQI